MMLRSPVSGQLLHIDGHALTGVEGERWPVVDRIAFLRADRRGLADAALAALDMGDVDGATVLLLGDQDEWAKTPPPLEADRRELVANRHGVTFRQAMSLLAFGPVGDYFAHRWSDPTFLSGLALLEAHGGTPARAFELACGAGHFLRVLSRHASFVSGGDIVFAKLWLARHFVAPDADLVCFDASAPWPFAAASHDLVFCHDALYFLPRKPHVADEMRRVAGAGTILVGHTHNALTDNFSSGSPLAPAGYAALFAPACLYDDAELTAAYAQSRAPVPAGADALASAAAIALVSGDAARARPVTGGWSAPDRARRLVRNPLYVVGDDGALERRFPSERYAREYGPSVTYPPTTDAPAEVFAGEADAALVRTRVLLDLPDRW